MLLAVLIGISSSLCLWYPMVSIEPMIYRFCRDGVCVFICILARIFSNTQVECVLYRVQDKYMYTLMYMYHGTLTTVINLRVQFV